MEVTTDALRERYADKPSSDLRRIAESAEGEYTPEAVTIAREVLASRASDEGEVPDADPSPAGSRWTGILAALAFLYAAKQAFSAWRDPQAFGVAVRHALSDPGLYALLALLLGWLWLRRWLRTARRG